MANASKNHMGPPGLSGKGDGSGAMTDDAIVEGRLAENMVLSNRDKKQHTAERGLDGKAVQTEQMQDHAANKRTEEPPPDGLSAEGPSAAEPAAKISRRSSSLKGRRAAARSPAFSSDAPAMCQMTRCRRACVGHAPAISGHRRPMTSLTGERT